MKLQLIAWVVSPVEDATDQTRIFTKELDVPQMPPFGLGYELQLSTGRHTTFYFDEDLRADFVSDGLQGFYGPCTVDLDLDDFSARVIAGCNVAANWEDFAEACEHLQEDGFKEHDVRSKAKQAARAAK